MNTPWTNVQDFFNETMTMTPDPRSKDWWLIQSPWPTLLICLSYVCLVKYCGPVLMKNRDPFTMRWFMVVYNFFMVLVSILLFLGFGIYGWFGKYNWQCQPIDYTDSPEATAMAHVCYWYYLSKFIEFTDTIIFVLRKKYNQVSTLHVIHHGIMPMSVWWGVKYTPGGHSTFFAFVNSFVHILMYIYYGLSAVGPSMNKYLWWKKHMTKIQIIQFMMIFTHSFQLMFLDCKYPRAFMWWIGFHAALFFFLFLEFYKAAYYRARQQGKLSFVFNGDISPCHPSMKQEKHQDNTRNGIYRNGITTNGVHSSYENGAAGDTVHKRKIK